MDFKTRWRCILIIIDNFIRDPYFLGQLEHFTLWEDPGVYKWADNPIKKKDNLAKKLISYIWHENCPLNMDLSIFEGFEYWTGIFEGGDRRESQDSDGNFYHLFRHFDKDEEEWKNTGNLICPKIGTVFYPHKANQNVIGGELKIWETQDNDICNIPYELLLPKHNRLVIFDPSHLHAVTMVKEGTRRAIAINLWENKPTTFLD